MTENPLGVKHLLGTDETGGPLEPWLVRGAITVIEKHLASIAAENVDGWPQVFEYGCGSSTPWLIDRAVHVRSVEQNPAWAAKVSWYLDSTGRPYSITVAPLPDDLRGYVNAGRWCVGCSQDLLLVDGRKRVKCILAAHEIVKPGGLLVLDNTERDYYLPAMDLLSGLGWERQDFENSLWRTTIWRRPTNG